MSLQEVNGPEMTAADAILTLLGERAADATICPSEAARRLAGPAGEWRRYMAQVHDTARILAREDRVKLLQKGVEMGDPVGAYRIGPVA